MKLKCLNLKVINLFQIELLANSYIFSIKDQTRNEMKDIFSSNVDLIVVKIQLESFPNNNVTCFCSQAKYDDVTRP